MGAIVRVLVCEDAEDTRTLFGDMLRLRGFDVIEVGTGSEALAAITDGDLHVAFLDIGLPDIDGFEVARRIRETPPLRPIRLIAVSGHATLYDVAMARRSGFDLHLRKPVTIDQMIAAMSTGSLPPT